MQSVKLGEAVERFFQKLNDNFAEVERDKCDASEVPTKASQLENDSGYQTAAQVQTAVAALAGAAPETLDTLKELADALGSDPNFAATVTAALGQKVDKAQGMGLSKNDLTDALLEKLNGLSNYTLPVAGQALGGVKNGGNVTVSADGTLTAPAGGGGAEVTRAVFTADDSRWGTLTDGTYTLTVGAAGKYPLGVYRKNGEAYDLVLCSLTNSGSNVLAVSYEKFEGYLLLI